MKRQEFYIYPRTKRKNTIWYIYAYDKFGILHSQSLGVSTRDEAMEIALERKKTGKYILEKFVTDFTKKKYSSNSPEILTFGKYSKNWWLFEKCDYIKLETIRGKNLSKRYCETNRRALNRHILPYFSKIPLSKISTMMIDTWILKLKDEKGLSNKTINNVGSILSIMLKEAVRKGLLLSNPYSNVKPFVNKINVHGIIENNECKKLFTNLKLWNGHYDIMLANLLALCTGMRQGEILALKGKDLYFYVDNNFSNCKILVQHSYDRKFGIKSTKNGKNRIVIVPEILLISLRKIAKGKNKFVFSSNGEKPYKSTTLTRWLYRALEQIGINDSLRKERNITFHSWRHTFNSNIITQGIPSNIVRKYTGHGSEEMTNHYFHDSDESDKLVLNVANDILYIATNDNLKFLDTDNII